MSKSNNNIVEVKQEYTVFLTNILTPLLYEGICSIYVHAKNCDRQFIEAAKLDPNVKVPGVLKIFQMGLKEMATLSPASIEKETIRIKTASKCAEWFDNLVKAVIKSNIALLSNNNLSNIDPTFHDKVDIKDFINKCYLETSNSIYNSPELFYHDYPTLQIKKNQQEIYAMIKLSIEEAIRKTLPYKLILEEYLTHREVTQDPTQSQFVRVQDLVTRDNKVNNLNKLNTQPKSKTNMFSSLLDVDGESDDENRDEEQENQEEEEQEQEQEDLKKNSFKGDDNNQEETLNKLSNLKNRLFSMNGAGTQAKLSKVKKQESSSSSPTSSESSTKSSRSAKSSKSNNSNKFTNFNSSSEEEIVNVSKSNLIKPKKAKKVDTELVVENAIAELDAEELVVEDVKQEEEIQVEKKKVARTYKPRVQKVVKTKKQSKK
jgi:hypothetical protein